MEGHHCLNSPSGVDGQDGHFLTVEGRWQQGRWTGQSWGEVGFLTEEVQENLGGGPHESPPKSTYSQTTCSDYRHRSAEFKGIPVS